MALCPVCRNALPEGTVGYCPNCGASLAASDATPPAGTGAPPPLPPLGSAPPLPLPGDVPPVPPTQPPRAGRAGGGFGRIPWDDRDRIGLLTALVETTREVLTAPARFFRAMPVTGGIGSPLLYAVIVGWVGVVATALYQAIFRSIAGNELPRVRRPAGGDDGVRLGRQLGRLRRAGRLRRRVGRRLASSSPRGSCT